MQVHSTIIRMVYIVSTISYKSILLDGQIADTVNMLLTFIICIYTVIEELIQLNSVSITHLIEARILL